MTEANSPIETYLLEAEELLADIEKTVLELEKDPGNAECVNRLFRDIHTIKGSGAMFGFEEIAGFSHHLENVLDQVRKGRIPVHQKLIDLILISKDYIKEILERAEASEPLNSEVGKRLVAEFAFLMPGTPPETGFSDDQDGSFFFSESDRKGIACHFRIRFVPHPGIMRNGMEPMILLHELRGLGELTVTGHISDVPDLGQMDPERCYLRWDMVLCTREPVDNVRDVFIFVEDGSQIHIDSLDCPVADDGEQGIPRLGDILVDKGDVAPDEIHRVLSQQRRLGELLVASGAVDDERVLSALEEQNALRAQKAKIVASSVRVPSEKLDDLINLVGELVIIQASITQMLGTLNEYREIHSDHMDENLERTLTEISAPVETLERLTRELRDCALNIRMLPIGTVFAKYRRLVRDLSTELGKEVDLVTEGGETELDKTVIERLSDPLMHLIRNAVDHGIQMPDKREAMGKPAKGIVTLSASHRGANVLITIEDDGMGLDAAAILSKAVEKGLVPADANLSEEEIYQLIFLPGLTTAKEVSSVSGRGVGMDVVRREINSLGGGIQIVSEPGNYTRFQLSLPLTLAIIDGLLVNVGGDAFVLPLSHVEECAEMTQVHLDRSHGRNMTMIRGELIPFIRLRQLFEMTGERPSSEHIAVVRADNQHLGVIVDEIVGNIQAVIKSLDRTLRHAEGISGATIMGDGTVALIVDIPGLLRLARKEEERLN